MKIKTPSGKQKLLRTKLPAGSARAMIPPHTIPEPRHESRQISGGDRSARPKHSKNWFIARLAASCSVRGSCSVWGPLKSPKPIPAKTDSCNPFRNWTQARTIKRKNQAVLVLGISKDREWADQASRIGLLITFNYSSLSSLNILEFSNKVENIMNN